MMSILRVGLLAGAAVLISMPAAVPASAQSLFGDGFWGEPSRPRAGPRNTQRPQPGQRRQPQSLFGDDDDERPRRSATAPLGPALLEGGPRPHIAAAAPPVVAYGGPQGAGTVVIDTRGRSLYYVLGGGRAYRYGVAVGREGFGWSGTQRVSRVAAWPDWHPPQEMRARDPRLPEKMTGGVNNPLGAKAIYLGSTLYRIHGTNDARSIGSASSSGCFRMTNSSVTHLSSLVNVGTTVQVVKGLASRAQPGVVLDQAAAAREAAVRRARG